MQGEVVANIATMATLTILLQFLTMTHLISQSDANTFNIKVKDGDADLKPLDEWEAKVHGNYCEGSTSYPNGEFSVKILDQPYTFYDFPFAVEVGILKKPHDPSSPYEKTLKFKFSDEDFEAWKKDRLKDLNVHFHKKAKGDTVLKGELKIEETDRVIQGVVPKKSKFRLPDVVRPHGLFSSAKKVLGFDEHKTPK